MARVLVVAAHPDDEILGMGGTLAVHAKVRGDDVRIVCVTDGSSTQYPGDAATRERKNAEALEAAAILGVTDYVHLDFPDMRLDTVSHVDVNRAIQEQVTAFGPTVVYTVMADVNLDHRAVFDSTNVATRPIPGQVVRRLLAYAPASSGEWTPPSQQRFIPSWYVDVSDTLELKLQAFACYRTEERPWPHPRSPRAIRATAEHHGSAIGVDAAEPFLLVRAVGDPP
jgi:LmbE family N-acetylglucosaminyl deacetylase